jgi:hypothetical protein
MECTRLRARAAIRAAFIFFNNHLERCEWLEDKKQRQQAVLVRDGGQKAIFPNLRDGASDVKRMSGWIIQTECHSVAEAWHLRCGCRLVDVPEWESHFLRSFCTNHLGQLFRLTVVLFEALQGARGPYDIIKLWLSCRPSSDCILRWTALVHSPLASAIAHRFPELFTGLERSTRLCASLRFPARL